MERIKYRPSGTWSDLKLNLCLKKQTYIQRLRHVGKVVH